MAAPATPRLPAGERLRRAGMGAWSVIGILILLYVSFWVLLKIRVIFPPLVLALLLIYLLNPLVSRIEARGVRRGIAVGIAYVIVLGLITMMMMVLIPVVSRQVENFRQEWPAFKLELVDTIEGSVAWAERTFDADIDTTQISCLLGVEGGQGFEVPTTEECDEVTTEFRERFLDQAGRITEIGLGVLEGLLVFILGPLLALYLLIDLPQLQRDLLNLIPEVHREEFADLGSKIGRAVGGFFRGQLFVAFIVGVLSALGFWVIGLPFWLVIGAVAGFFNLIPLIGPFVGGGIGFLVGVVSEGFGLGLQAVIVELVIQQLDNHVISPNVMKRTVNLHPVTVMLSILAGGALAGFWGVLLGVPAVAVGKLLLGHLWTTRVLGEEDSPYVSVGADRAEPAEEGAAPEK